MKGKNDTKYLVFHEKKMYWYFELEHIFVYLLL